MRYRWIEHTAELELELEAPTEAALFGQALEALGELLSDGRPVGPAAELSLQVSLTGRERALLLADWLDELVFRAETEGLIPRELETIDLGEDGLRATVRCAVGDPRPLVKGITHHRLTFERSGRGFSATVVLDV